jgi:hypothetical protein
VNRPEDPSNLNKPAGDFFEKFLFYRGVGNFELPISVQSLGHGEFKVKNSGPDAIRSLFLVNVTGDRVKFAQFEQVAGMQELKMSLPADKASVDELAEAVVAALVDEKLYEKEARAMVATWRTSWFGEEGTRLLYSLPRQVTDTLLPLNVEPMPNNLVRVLVGRLEIMTREDETYMNEVVQIHAGKRRSLELKVGAKSADLSAAQLPLPDCIRKLGRLAEPMLTRVKETAKDELVKREAGILLAELVAAMNAVDNSAQ